MMNTPGTAGPTWRGVPRVEQCPTCGKLAGGIGNKQFRCTGPTEHTFTPTHEHAAP